MIKVTEDGHGKFIIDFQGMEVDMTEAKSIESVSALFDSNVVSQVKHGFWRFEKGQKNMFLQGSKK